MSKKGEIIQTEKNFKQIEQQIKENEDKIGVLKEDLNTYTNGTDEKINSLTTDLNGLQSSKIFNVKCTFENNNYILTLDEDDLKIMPQYLTIRFKAPNDYVDSAKFIINEELYISKNANFETNDIVTCEFDKNDKKCFFKSGGGRITETLPPQVENFNARGGDCQIELSWTIKSKTYLDGYIFVVKEKEIPNNINDGIKYAITKDKNNVVIDGLKNDVLYCARSFPYNYKKQYQTAYMIIGARPKGNTILLKDLPIGSKVKDLNSKYNNNVMTWIIADKNHNGYPNNSITLISEKGIGKKGVDAIEPSTPNNNAVNDRQKYANNNYKLSNIRQWLNSDKEDWFVKQHEYDEPPNKDNVAYNPYDTEKGFMCNLSDEFKNNLLNTNLTVVIPSVDGGGSETITDKIFLLSKTEVGLGNENGISEGSKFSMFSDDESRQLDNDWWLRTSAFDYGHYTYYITVSKGLTTMLPYAPHIIRPTLNIKSDVLVSTNPDSDGCYILKL